ncbi:hypothetical protein [Tenacibaculum xiamenense]|uniref:hypothetical protein n=1 Tax=Tenacibaculum xiamenense TaxID=1261553 RepID=UPI003893C0DA
MINIFVGLSNNQVRNYENLVPILEKGNHILIANKGVHVNKNLFSEVIYSRISLNNQSNGSIDAITNIIRKIKEYQLILDKIIRYKEEKNISLYFTSLEDILANYLFFSFNKNMKTYVVEDGTLNYYYHSIENLSLNKMWLKKIISYLYGIRYVIYKGHSSGIEYEKVKKQYVRSPELSICPEKSVSLPYLKRKTQLNNSVLIIGQEPYIHHFGKELYIERLKELCDLAKQNDSYIDSKRVYYKPHRNGERIDYDVLIAEFENKEVCVLSSEKSLEDLYFDELGAGSVYSFDSSALLNIYLEADDDVRGDIKFYVLLKYNKLLKPIFKRFKFEVFE